MRKKGIPRHRSIKDAFLNIDRKNFVLDKYTDSAYEDRPLPIGKGQTISQPSTVAFMLELLRVKSGHKILDIGSGSGYTTALLAYLAGDKGKVWAVERVAALREQARKNLSAYPSLNYELLAAGKKIGLPGNKFDRILVSAAADELPKELLSQLDSPGRLVIPIHDSVYLYHKDSKGNLKAEKHYGFSFVPLIEE